MPIRSLTAFLTAILLSLSAATHAAPVKTESLSFDARLTGYDYDFPVKTHKLASQVQTLEMAYGLLKGDDDKPAITLLHGKNFNGFYWGETAKFLNGLGYTVLIPDQIGFGKSSKPRHYQFSFAALASHTRELMDSLGIKKSIILGHSMGGMLASRFALMYPEATEQLILLNPIGLENYLQYVQYKDTDFFYNNESRKTPQGIRSYQQKNYYDGKWTDKYDELTHFMIGQIQGPDKDLIAWVNALTYDMIFTQPVITEYQHITVPTALIIGTRDRTGPGRGWKRPGVTRELGRYDRLGDAAAALIPKATLFKLDDLGHLPHIEDFDRFTATLKKALNRP